MQILSAASARRLVAPLALGVLLLATGCKYNEHRNMGATEKWEGSDMHTIPKVIGMVFVSIPDALIGPGTMLWDQVAYDPEYDPRHKYFTYCSSRTVARSEMGMGYQWMATVPTLIFDTVWLLVTGPIDLVWVLGFGEDESPPPGSEFSGGYVAYED